MKNIVLIIQREYLTRVKKKSFIIMTILAPLLMMVMYGIIIWAAISGTEQKSIVVVDDSGLFTNRIGNSSEYLFEYLDSSLDEAKTVSRKVGKMHWFIYRKM
jgi:ABC-2 type transport system permease protein